MVVCSAVVCLVYVYAVYLFMDDNGYWCSLTTEKRLTY